MDHKARKADHIRINLEEDVQFPRLTTGLEKFRFVHQALPELNMAQVNLAVELFGHAVQVPLLISSMTGGTEVAERINRNLAIGAQARGVAMGVGSQRTGLEVGETADSFRVRDVAPDILLFANLGAAQLNKGYTVDHCRRAVDMIEADALILHLNPLQEAVQADGDWDWTGLLDKIEQVCAAVGVPVVAKEVGWGFSREAAQQLLSAGVAALDVAGAGGTSWSQVEMYRAPTAKHARVAGAFVDWGIPTAVSLRYCREAAPHLPVFASGGIRNGIDVAKCIALGANLVGIAGDFLRAADAGGVDGVIELAESLTAELRVAMLCAGAGDLSALAETPLHNEF